MYCHVQLFRIFAGDTMDGVYDKLWDVTVLEYAVSMHTRRGDHSRKKLALEKVQAIHVDLVIRPQSTLLMLYK